MNAIGELSLSANFSPLPLCDPTSNLKFNTSTLTCSAITNCVKASLNANYCSDENTPLSCYTNYYLDSGNDGTALTPAVCTASCSNNSPRHPGSNPVNALCNYNCLNVSSCPNSSVSQMKSYPSNYLCQTGFSRANYKCIQSTIANKSAFFFSNYFNTPNIYRDFNVVNTKITSGYLLEFWMKLDNVYNINNISLPPPGAYYFFSIPHTIYLNPSTNVFYYQDTSLTYNYQMQSIQKYEWNRIIFKFLNQGNSNNLYIFVNYKFTTPEVTIKNIPVSVNMNLLSIAFCSTTSGTCLPQGSPRTINWGSAYYSNVRVWDASLATEWLVQSYGVGMLAII